MKWTWKSIGDLLQRLFKEWQARQEKPAPKPQPPAGDPEGHTPPAPPIPEPPAPPPPTPPAPTADEPTWDAINMVCKNASWRFDPGKAKVTRTLRSAKWQGSQIRLDYDSIAAWPRHEFTNPDGSKWHSWGGLCVAWKDGDTLVTSWFDHIVADAKLKVTSNWHNGYVLGGVPRDGRQLWIYLMSTNGAQRSTMSPLK